MWLISLLLCISLSRTMGLYNEDFNRYALNISQASYCVGSPDQWNCNTCGSSVNIINVVENGGVRALNAIDNTYEKIIGKPLRKAIIEYFFNKHPEIFEKLDE